MKEKQKLPPFAIFLIVLCAVFLCVMLILPLVYIIFTAFREGISIYLAAITDSLRTKGRDPDH